MAAAAAPVEVLPLSEVVTTKPVLFDFPISNNGGQVRLVIYGKGLEDEIEVRTPAVLGGHRSEQYQKLNPQMKVPLLVLPGGMAIPESEVISEYIVDKYRSVGPSYIASTPEKRALVNLCKRVLDIYIKPSLPAMYRGGLTVEARAEGIAQLNKQLDVLEGLVVAEPYAVGEELTTADTALFPNFIFLNFMLTKIFGWPSIFTNRPKLQRWWEFVSTIPEFQRLDVDITKEVQGWEASGRWESLGILADVANPNFQWKY